MPEPALDSHAPERRPVSPRALALGSAVIAALLVLVAFVAYRELIHYDRHAIEHVPAGADLALRIDLEQVVLFDPVRRHLLPLVDRAPVGAGAIEPGRLLRLREAGVNLGMDLRELVFARQPGGGWVLAFGGIFGSEPLVPRIEAVLRTEPEAHSSSAGGVLVLQPSGVALAQADDQVLLVASDAALLASVRAPGNGYEAIGLSRSGAAAFGALGGWLDGLGTTDTAAAASPLARATARLGFGDPLELDAALEHEAPVDVATARHELDAWLGTPQDAGNFAPQADWGGERALLARARLTQASPTRVAVATTWARADFDRAVRSLAVWLEPRLHASGPVAR
ncbi:MAG TPA: hypothetical protein VMG12_34215 [Polyangiaceae bacterium]|nr:hypothetical protein [Polyangiaceae bacterium]